MAPNGVVSDPEGLNNALTSYSRLIRPWARAVASKMIARVSQRDEKAWLQMSSDMGRSLRKELETAPTGIAARILLEEQVDLITSIPLDAARRIHKLTLEGITTGRRPGSIAEEIMKQTGVSASKAVLIARTEVARTASVLTQARAEHVGSTHYIWKTSKDADVRDSHRAMQGKVIAWDDPPTTDNLVGHAGQLPNCRCFPEPIFPDED